MMPTSVTRVGHLATFDSPIDRCGAATDNLSARRRCHCCCVVILLQLSMTKKGHQKILVSAHLSGGSLVRGLGFTCLDVHLSGGSLVRTLRLL